jgi:exopolyphosphatase/guanosine-5'-triphosphate,3'-diphosphate pyrophosphatase
VADPQLAGTLKPKLKKRELELAMTPLGIGLFGEVAQARFNSLAQALRMSPVVTTAVA